MISKSLNPISIMSPEVNAEWVAVTAGRVLAAVEERRSTWQSWHVRAEAQRQVRTVQVPHEHNITQPAATRAALGAASRIRSEPLKPGLRHDA
jgi:hypothetical protein